MKFSSDNKITFNDISFAAGVWNYADDLNVYIREVTKEGDLEFNARTFRISITLKSNYQLDLTKKSCYLIVSHTKLILFPNSNFLYAIFFHLSNSFVQFDYIILQIMYKTSSSTDSLIDSSNINYQLSAINY